MKKNQKELAIANLIELGTRVLKGVVGDDLSTKIDGDDVEENAEMLISTKLSERLITKVG